MFEILIHVQISISYHGILYYQGFSDNNDATEASLLV